MIEILRATVRVAAAAVLMLGTVNSADAAFVLKFSNSYTSDSATPQGGPGTWLTATFKDNSDDSSIAAGKVLLTLTANFVGPEIITATGFNYNGANGLLATSVSGPTFSFSTPSANSLNGGGAPSFDFGLNFPTSGNPSTNRFDGTETATILLSATSAITASNFNVAKNGFYAGIHIQRIATGSGSGKYRGEIPPPPKDEKDPPSDIPGVPEPGTLALLAMGSIGLGGYRKLRSRKEIAA